MRKSSTTVTPPPASRSHAKALLDAPQRASAATPKRKVLHRENSGAGHLDEGTRHQLISEAAYFRAQQRGFDGDRALDDWLEAEREIVRSFHS